MCPANNSGMGVLGDSIHTIHVEQTKKYIITQPLSVCYSVTKNSAFMGLLQCYKKTQPYGFVIQCYNKKNVYTYCYNRL